MVFRLAKIFGKTSPKNKIKNVTNEILMVNLVLSFSTVSKKEKLLAKNKTTIAMLSILLAINNVTNNFLGRSSNRVISLAFLGFETAAFSKSCAEIEKKATSAPEIKAAKKSKTTIIIIPKTTEKSRLDAKCKLGGSVSKR